MYLRVRMSTGSRLIGTANHHSYLRYRAHLNFLKWLYELWSPYFVYIKWKASRVFRFVWIQGHLLFVCFFALLSWKRCKKMNRRTKLRVAHIKPSLITRFMGPTWAHLGPTGPRWAPCWPHELCYLGCISNDMICRIAHATLCSLAGVDACWYCVMTVW